MKKVIGVLLIIFTTALWAMPTNDTNIAKGKTEIAAIELTTLQDADKLFDGVISSKPEYSSATAVKKGENLNIVFKLKHPFYIRKIVIAVDKNDSCKSIIARYSKNTTFWVDMDDVQIKETPESLEYTFVGHNILANYLAFVFTPNPNKNILRIQEIQIYPEMEIRLRDRYVKDNWISTDRECFDNIDTRIDTVKFMKFSKVGVPADQKYKKIPSPVLEGELFSVDNLEPGTPYDYIMSLTDYNGNMLDLNPRQFMTKPLSLAYNKKTEGTFNEAYSGAKIEAGLNPITDGSFDINKGMAISGPVNQADQYVIIDLDQQRTFSEITTMWRNLGYSKDYSLQISNDKQNWQNIAQNQNAELNEVTRVNGHPVRVLSTKLNAPVSARYIKLQIAKGSAYFSKHGTGKLELFEVKVFN